MEAQLKEACRVIDNRKDDLNRISQEIWSNPELNFKEFKAHELLTTFLEKEGFNVQKKTPLETSFIAKYGDSSGIKIGICVEYDALPGVGHACGHNLIAEAGIAAALGIKEVIGKYENKAQLIVYGTPAEEGGGGKVFMIEKKVFDDADFCMMSHPTPVEIPTPVWLARTQLTIVYKGKASHAAAAPWEGINALDAAIQCYNNVSMLRQQMKPTIRIHGVITDGGEKPNIIPERSALNYYVRGLIDEDVLDARKKVIACAEGAASATGCTVTITQDDPFYSAVKTNKPLIDMYVKHVRSLGVLDDDSAQKMKLLASTDMGNVSQIKPSIHPLFKIQTTGANHTHEFTKDAGDQKNQLPTLNSGKAMAMTAIEVMCNPGLLNDVKKDFEETK